MPMKLACPACQAPLALGEAQLGKKVQCGGCKHIFIAYAPPPQVEVVLEAEIVDTPAAPPPPTPVPEPPPPQPRKRRRDEEDEEEQQ